MKYGIIGAGVSGLSIAHLLSEKNEIIIFEKDDKPGGLIKCDIVSGNLYHKVGGHVFNTKRNDVRDWFWSFFDKENDFVKALRNSSIALSSGQMIPYPIENHAYLLEDGILKSFIKDLVILAKSANEDSQNFEEFLQRRFGNTLYKEYFQPYNYKVWKKDLTKVPLSWLEGKLPMPTVEEILYNNINHIEEREFVHSSFYYPVIGGSQFLADRMAKNLDIEYNSPINRVERQGNKWIVNGHYVDRIIFCGNIKQLALMLNGQLDISGYNNEIDDLEFHGTTSVFCEIQSNPYSWIYLPSYEYESHRIICTGNFAKSNNAFNLLTGTVEFTDFISKEEILNNLKRMPFSPQYLAHHYEKYTYPIQNANTRNIIQALKLKLENEGIYLLGRFAEWEYYNMDVAMGAAIDLYNLKFK